MVKAGNGRSLEGVEGDTVDCELIDVFDRGIPPALFGSRITRMLAKSKMPSRYKGRLAKIVIDNKSGRTRIVHEVRNPKFCFANRLLSTKYSDADN